MQLHAAYAGLRLTRTTRDVDMILHIDSGAATFAGVQQELERLGHVLREPIGDGPVHRFARGSRGAETIDVMVADRLSPKQHHKALRRKVFAVPGGTSALRKTVNCEVTAGEVVVVLSIPDLWSTWPGTLHLLTRTPVRWKCRAPEGSLCPFADRQLRRMLSRNTCLRIYR